MKLLLDTQRTQLIANGRANGRRRADGQQEIDFRPIVKLFTPDAAATWLLTEIDPEDSDIAFGLCDLGTPEIGNVSLNELASVRGKLGLPVERDRYFRAEYTLAEYADAAAKAGYIRA